MDLDLRLRVEAAADWSDEPAKGNSLLDIIYASKWPDAIADEITKIINSEKGFFASRRINERLDSYLRNEVPKKFVQNLFDAILVEFGKGIKVYIPMLGTLQLQHDTTNGLYAVLSTDKEMTLQCINMNFNPIVDLADSAEIYMNPNPSEGPLNDLKERALRNAKSGNSHNTSSDVKSIIPELYCKTAYHIKILLPQLVKVNTGIGFLEYPLNHNNAVILNLTHEAKERIYKTNNQLRCLK